MKIEVYNDKCELVIGGTDHLVDPNLFTNIRDYLSVKVPGAYHTWQYQKHVWDGKKYYLTPKGKMSTGMLPILLDYLDEVYPDLLVEIVDCRANMVALRTNLKTGVGDYKMDGNYEFQKRLVRALDNTITFRGEEIYFPRGIVDAATNAGKTTIIAGYLLNCVGDVRMLILINRKKIYKQLVDFMGNVFGDVGQVNDKYYEIRPVTVAMTQSLTNRIRVSAKAKSDVAGFNAIAVDECHIAGYEKILKYSDAYARLFLSGTALDSTDLISKLNIVSLSGPKLAEVKKAELMLRGISTKVEVKVHLSNTLLYKQIITYKEYVRECVHYSSERVAIIGQIIKHASGPVIVAVQEIHHGQFIYDRFQEMNISKAFEFTHGEDPQSDEKIEKFKQGLVEVLITTAIIREGVNLPTVKEIVYAVGGKSKISVKQWMGRAERLCGGKDKATFHDFYDIGKYVERHSEKRLAYYKEEDLPIFTTFDLKEAKKLRSIFV